MSNGPKTEIWYYRMVFSFFTEEKMRNMKHLPMFGYQFIVIFLELCGLATPQRGCITIQGYMPDSIAPVLAKDIGEDAEITMQALNYFKAQRLINVWYEDGSTKIQIPFLDDKIGKRSLESQKRYQRKLAERNRESEQLALQRAQEEQKKNCRKYGFFQNVFLTDEEHRQLNDMYRNAEELIRLVGIEKKRTGENDPEETDYERCLEKGKTAGKKYE